MRDRRRPFGRRTDRRHLWVVGALVAALLGTPSAVLGWVRLRVSTPAPASVPQALARHNQSTRRGGSAGGARVGRQSGPLAAAVRNSPARPGTRADNGQSRSTQ